MKRKKRDINEKLSVLAESKFSNVRDIIKKYDISRSTFYKWKKSFEMFPEFEDVYEKIILLEKQVDRLSQELDENKLVLAIKEETIRINPPTNEEKIKLAALFLVKFPNASKKLVLKACGLSYSSYFNKGKTIKKGRRVSSTTLSLIGKTFKDEDVLHHIRQIKERAGSHIGYIKISGILREMGFVINKKKVYRLMKDSGLLKK
jgi:transposase-like protein